MPLYAVACRGIFYIPQHTVGIFLYTENTDNDKDNDKDNYYDNDYVYDNAHILKCFTHIHRAELSRKCGKLCGKVCGKPYVENFLY